MNRKAGIESRAIGRVFLIFAKTASTLLSALWLFTGCNVLSPENSENDPALRIVDVTDLGLLETNAIIRGRDGGYSGVFRNRSIWLYGDTVLEQEGEDGQTWRHNSWSWTSDLNAADGVTGFQERVDAVAAPKEFFPLTPTEKAFNDAHLQNGCVEEPCGARWALWPGAMVNDFIHDRALIFYSKIYAEPGDLNFRAVGYSVAVWDDFEAEPIRPEFQNVPDEPMLLFGANDPSFGSAAIVVDSTLYIYGRGHDNISKPIHIAKVVLAKALDLSAWQFYNDKERWTANLEASGPVFNGNDIMSIWYNTYLGKFIAIYSKPLGRDVVLRTADKPEGPWSSELKIFKAKKPASENGWIYDALAHPEYSRADGRLNYLTYSRVTGFFASEVRLVSVEISLLK